MYSRNEENSATLRFVREALRLKPPAGAFRRVNRKEDGERTVEASGYFGLLFSVPADLSNPNSSKLFRVGLFGNVEALIVRIGFWGSLS